MVIAVVPGCRRKAAEEQPPAASATAAERAPVKIVYPAAPGSFVDVASKVSASVVRLRAESSVSGGPATLVPQSSDKRALGSGFIISNDGHILTSDRLVATVGAITVELADGKTYAAQIVGRDARLDVALLKIDATPPLAVVRQGSSDDLTVGEWVVAIGRPFGTPVVTSGIVSSLGLSQDSAIAGAAIPNLESFIVTDARINALHLGGPLVNTAGEVVGIATASDVGGGAVGFAVPIDRAKLILPMLRENGTVQRAWIGIYVREVALDRAAELELGKTGALVTDVVDTGPGDAAGIVRGDIIVEFDGRKVSHRNLPGLVATAGMSRSIDVVVLRSGARTNLVIVTGPMPE